MTFYGLKWKHVGRYKMMPRGVCNKTEVLKRGSAKQELALRSEHHDAGPFPSVDSEPGLPDLKLLLAAVSECEDFRIGGVYPYLLA